MRFQFLYIACFFLSISITYAQVDDTKAALNKLEDARGHLLDQLQQAAPAEKAILLRKMLTLGLWKEAIPIIQKGEGLSEIDQNLLLARYYWLNNLFQEAEKHSLSVLQIDPDNLDALKIKATLFIESWQLQKAIDLCELLLSKQHDDNELSLILGRALLLQHAYDKALILAKKLQQRHPQLAAAYLLEADVYFWNQQPEKATPLIVKALALDPFDANARFSYGYAIWRRVDATQLNQMAAQWDLALALNPLHFQTHWHWGNGHTNLTFADYADAQEVEIRKKLKPADSLMRQNKINKALDLTKQVAKQYPLSVLPLMHQASLYYSNFDSPQREKNLDSAEVVFRQILDKKPHYGPAHNGLSAVIKSKRIPYLSTYDSIKTTLRQVKIKDLANFKAVFPDVAYYPGDLAKAMVWNQLYTSTVYFPFLAKQGNTFVIPALHEDLAIAMKRPFFRSSTTFDNRQWMDIRGVGSGAAAIEYVERGAYQERNVILHEYVHLFHGRVLTDKENRRIRALYYSAMQHNRTLDYYSQNNESEYFAQTYPAYFELVKVHPLDFKSMNTKSALIEKDPEMYHFLDSLIKKEKRYLNGDKKAMAGNWSEVYINLSDQVTDSCLAQRLLDTALQYDTYYQPAYLAYAKLQLKQKKFQEALRYIEAAKKIDSNYAPIYQVEAEWLAQSMHGLNENHEASIAKQGALLKKALALESDYQTSAQLATALRTLYDQQGKIGLAIQAADEYIETGAEISTYLRDRKDEARVYAALQKACLGDSTQLVKLNRLADMKPQNFEFQLASARALTYHNLFKKSNKRLFLAQKIMAANQNRRADFDLQIAKNYFALHQVDSASFYLKQSSINKNKLSNEDKQRMSQLLLALNRVEEANSVMKDTDDNQAPHYLALKHYTDGLLAEKKGQTTKAIGAYQQSLVNNPYLMDAYQRLSTIYKKQGNDEALNKLITQHQSLFMP